MFSGAVELVTGKERVMCDCCIPVDKLSCADSMLMVQFLRNVAGLALLVRECEQRTT